MKILEMAVMVKTSKGQFYERLVDADRPYLVGILTDFYDDDKQKVVPMFACDPSFFSPRIAKLHASELRRAGYLAKTMPYIVFAVISWIKKKKASKWH